MCALVWFYWILPLLTKSTYCAVPQLCKHKCLAYGLGTSWSGLKIIFSPIMLASVRPLVFQEVFEEDGESRRAKLYETKHREATRNRTDRKHYKLLRHYILSLLWLFCKQLSVCKNLGICIC